MGRVDTDCRASGRLRAAVRRDSRSTGDFLAHCVAAAWSSPPSRWRQASRRRAIPRSDARLPFDEPYRVAASTASVHSSCKNERRPHRSRGDDGRSRAGAFLRSNRRRQSLTSASARRRSSASSMRSFPGPTGRRRATIRCYVRSSDDNVLARAGAALEASSYRTHEFGDSVLIFSQPDSPRQDILISSTDCAGRNT